MASSIWVNAFFFYISNANIYLLLLRDIHTLFCCPQRYTYLPNKWAKSLHLCKFLFFWVYVSEKWATSAVKSVLNYRKCHASIYIPLYRCICVYIFQITFNMPDFFTRYMTYLDFSLYKETTQKTKILSLLWSFATLIAESSLLFLVAFMYCRMKTIVISQQVKLHSKSRTAL